MADLTLPGEIDAEIDNRTTAHSISKAGGHSGYVVQGADISPFYASLDESAVNSFAHVSDSGLDITIDAGEAYLYGWLCRDRQTTVTLPASSTVTVCVGYNVESILGDTESPPENDNIVIDIESNFGNGNPCLELYEVTTTSSAIDSITNVRPMGPSEVQSDFFATDGQHNSLRNDHDSLKSDYDSFRSSGGSIGGAATIGGDLTVNGTDLSMPNADGNEGLQLSSGAAFSMYEDWATVYSYSTEGGAGFRFRNPDESGNKFTVDNVSGDGWFEGALQADGQDVPTSGEPIHFEISTTEPSNYDVWFEIE